MYVPSITVVSSAGTVLVVLVKVRDVELVLLVVLLIGAEPVESVKPLWSTVVEFDDSLVAFSISAEYDKFYQLKTENALKKACYGTI